MASSAKPMPSNFNLVDSIDAKKANDIFIKYGFSDSAKELGLEYLNEILRQLKIYAADVGYTDLLQSRLEIFEKLIVVIEEFNKKLEQLERPRRRHLSDRDSPFRIDEPGTGAFRRVMAGQFAAFYSPESNIYSMLNYADFQELVPMPSRDSPCRPDARSRTRQEFTSFRIDEFIERITPSMVPITQQLLNCLKNATLAAVYEMRGMKNSKGGQGKHPLELSIIRVLATLWYRAFDGQRRIYANASNPDLLDFINENCALLGLPNIATEYAINKVRPMVEEGLVATNTR